MPSFRRSDAQGGVQIAVCRDTWNDTGPTDLGEWETGLISFNFFFSQRKNDIRDVCSSDEFQTSADSDDSYDSADQH